MLGGILQSDAVAGVPSAQCGGALGVVGEEEVLDGVGDALLAALEVRPDPPVHAGLVCRGAGRPLGEGQHAHQPRVGRMGATMRTALVVLLLTLVSCSDEPSGPASSADPVSEAPRPACRFDTSDRLGPPTRVATEYLQALRDHDEDAVYDLAAAGLREQQTREEFTTGLAIDGVQDARISGITRTGWTEDGSFRAVVPVQVTVSGVIQEGRVVLTRENGEWRFVAAVSPPEAPDLSVRTPPVGSRRAHCEIHRRRRPPVRRRHRRAGRVRRARPRTPTSWRWPATRCTSGSS